VLYPRKLVSLRAGTSQAGAAGTITLDASASAVDDYYNGCLIVAVLDGATEARIITDYVGSTKVASVTPNWNTTPDSDDTFTIYLPEGTKQVAQADAVAWLGSGLAAVSVAGVPEVDVTHFNGTAGTFASGRPEVNVSHWLGTAAATPTVAGVPEVDITHYLGAASPALVGGRFDASVGAMAAGVVTAAAVATGAIDADALAADAGTEIGTAVWATAARTLTASTNLGDLDDAILAILGTPAGASMSADIAAVKTQTAAIETDTGTDIPATLATLATAAALTTVDDFLDTEIAAIKAKTDSLTFTVAGQVDANIQAVNDVTVNGVGTAGNPWGP
jgi:hypothetical protein